PCAPEPRPRRPVSDPIARHKHIVSPGTRIVPELCRIAGELCGVGRGLLRNGHHLVSNINRKDLLMSRNRLRLLGGAAVAAVAIIASAGAASAHVEVNPGTAVQGGEATFGFQVPNEQESASTTKVQVSLPADQPLGSVLLMPHPGWTSTVTKAKLATPIKTDDGEVTEPSPRSPGPPTHRPRPSSRASSTSSSSPPAPCPRPTPCSSRRFRPTPTAPWSAGSTLRTPTAASPSTPR